MQIRLRVAPFGKVPEIYRGKRTAFADVENGVANINIKGDFVGDDVHLTLPYQTTEYKEQNNDDVYQNMIRRATQQMSHLLRKKERIMIKRSHVLTTRDLKKKKKTKLVLTPRSAPLARLAPSQHTNDEEDIADEQVNDDTNMESMLTSMFGDFDMSDLLQHFEETQQTSLQQNEDDDDKCFADDEDDHNKRDTEDEDDKDKKEQEDDDNEDDKDKKEQEDDDNEEDVDNVEDEESGNAAVLTTTTLYRDGEMVESFGPLEHDSNSDLDFDSDGDYTSQKKRSKSLQQDDVDSAFSSSSDDNDNDRPVDDIDGDLSLFGNNDDPLSDHEDFDMYAYDGLADIYED